jgi:hypothetical protein
MKPRGEYWITDYGLRYADGDVGDFNHEAIVQEHAQGIFLSEIGADAWDLESKTFEECILTWAAEEYDDWSACVKKAEEAGQGWDDVLWEKLKDDGLDLAQVQQIYRVAEGGGDLREYAMNTWGWIWVRETFMGAARWDAETRKRVVHGINEILEEEPSSDEEEEVIWTIRCIDTGMEREMTLQEIRENSLGGGTSSGAEVKGSAQVRKLDEDGQPSYYQGTQSGG